MVEVEENCIMSSSSAAHTSRGCLRFAVDLPLTVTASGEGFHFLKKTKKLRCLFGVEDVMICIDGVSRWPRAKTGKNKAKPKRYGPGKTRNPHIKTAGILDNVAV